MNTKERIMKPSTIAKTFTIAAVTVLALGLAPTAKADDKGCTNATLQGTFDWFRQQEVDTVEVGTQMQNAGACRLYGQCGFRMVRMSLTYRRLL